MMNLLSAANKLLLLVCILTWSLLFSCKKDKDQGPSPIDLTSVAVDTTEIAGITYLSPNLEIPPTTESERIDLNNDGIRDVQFEVSYWYAASGYERGSYKFTTINPNCLIIGQSRIDTIANWRRYDAVNDRNCYATIMYNQAQSNYDTLLSYTEFPYFAAAKLEMGDSVTVDQLFEAAPQSEYVLSISEYDMVDYVDFCSLTNINHGKWRVGESGFVAFKINRSEGQTIGWFQVVTGSGNLILKKIAYLDIDN